MSSRRAFNLNSPISRQIVWFYLFGVFGMSACTGQLPSSFRLAQVEQTFAIQQEINTKIDLLWVVDNSASMDISQEKLRRGFAGFAQKYMQPTWDIRVAVITTDTYLANEAFGPYLNQTIPYTPGWKSQYVGSRLGTFVNPSWNPNLVNLSTGKFDNGVTYGELVPVWGRSFARLLPGMHDGPIPAFCSELRAYFLKGVTNCATRDDQLRTTGPEKCLRPDIAAGQSSVTQCVNTIQNDTVRSGKAILSTLPPAGIAPDASWTNQLIDDFIINVSTGSAGDGSERGLGSVLQLLDDNENTDTAFFRQGSLRGIIFVSDEEDQTMELPRTPPNDFRPQSFYRCDQEMLEALNGAQAVRGYGGYCCDDPANNCRYGSEGLTCPSKTIDGYTYSPSLCPKEEMLVPVAEIKSKIDKFFSDLDGGDSAGAASYFVTSIVPLTAEAIRAMQAERNRDDTAVGALKTAAVDRGDRYLELGRLVGNGSLDMNIADDNYSPLLDAIGKTIINKKSSFPLDRAPTKTEDMLVKVIHEDGSATIITDDKFMIQGKVLVITDQDFVLGLKATDRMVINYQPKTVF